MADEETRSLLQEWEIDACIVERFRENGITKDLIKDLTHDLLKEIIPSKNIEEFSDTESVSSSSADENISDDVAKEYFQKVKRQKCFIGKKTYERALRPNVNEIIASTQQGRAILRGYKNKPLSREARNDIIKIIIDSIINNVKGRLNSDDFYDLARGIVEIFPKEDLNAYYVAPIKKKYSQNNKSTSMRGKLVKKYRNRVQRVKRALQGCSESSDETTSISNQSSKDTDTTEVIDQSG
ncbi:unnamed protein product [Lasius platythorax]|uniref:Uncharacterized protein n=1 Tax=Lasius platythorax TaxID=488582 RepID=A0AAV2MWT8_9HYME